MDIVSYIPGRLRIRSDYLYRNVSLASQLYNELYSIQSVYSVKINTYTSKLLIIYDKRNASIQDILSNIQAVFEKKHKYGSVQLNNRAILKSKCDLHCESRHIYDIKSTINFGMDPKYINQYFKYILFIFIGVYLTLISGQYLQFIYFLLTILVYKIISLILDRLLFKTFKVQSKKQSSIESVNINDSIVGFYNRIVPIIMIITVFYSIKMTDYKLFLSIIILLIFNSLKKSTSIVLSLMPRMLLNNGVTFINWDKLDEITSLETVIIDKTMDNADIEISFIENLRAHGIWDIHVFTNNINIESQAKNLELKVFKINSNDLEKSKYIDSLKKDNKVIGVIAKKRINIEFSKEIDVKICITENIQSVNTKTWDLVVNNSYGALGEAFDYSKYALEKIYQNQLISLWLLILGIVFSFSEKIKIIYIGLISIVSRILVYLNSLKLLSYERIYV